MEKYLGIDIGGTKCAVIIGDENGDVLKKVSFKTTAFQETFNKILEVSDELFDDDILAIGISCGGPLDSKKGIIMSPACLQDWIDVHIVDIFEKRYQRPTYLKNDADACAIAEWKWGNGVGYRNVVFLTFGTGMGAGLIIDNHPYSGTNDLAGEVGHIRLHNKGHIGCRKAGSFEGCCSGKGIFQYGYGTAKEIAEKARRGDKKAISIYKQVGRDLGKGLSIIIDILNPEIIIIGSIYSRSGELMNKEMMKVLKKEALSLSLSAVKILPAKLGDSIGDKAALSIAFDGYHQGDKNG